MSLKPFRKFTTQHVLHERVNSNLGSRVVPVYSPKLDERGNLELEVTGQENLYDMIQSHKDSCDINLIVQRFRSGDVDALNKRQAAFIDTLQMPKNYAEMLNTVIACEDYFTNLPLEIRQKFDNNFGSFMSEYGSESWADKLGLVENAHMQKVSAPLQKPFDVVEKEVKIDE